MPVPDVNLNSSWEEVDIAAAVIKNGVQKDNLSSGVKNSLDKADNSLQTSAQIAKTPDMTQRAGVDENGGIWVPPGQGSGGAGQFVVTLNSAGIPNASSNDIYAAWQSGKVCKLRSSIGVEYNLQSCSLSSAYFATAIDATTHILVDAYTIEGITATHSSRNGYVKPDSGIPASDLAADAKPLVVTVTPGTITTCDYTPAQIQAAHAAGRQVMLTDGTNVGYALTDVSASKAVFTATLESSGAVGLSAYIVQDVDQVTHVQTNPAGSDTVGGPAKKAASILAGTVGSSSTSTAFTAQIDGITELRDGVCVLLNNNKVNSAAGCTLNINGLGAKPIYSSLAASTAVSTTFKKGYTMLFLYDSTRVTGGCWVMYYGYDANTTYTNASLGSGYATCTTEAATAAKAATLSSYALTTGGIVGVKFTNAVQASATLNINSKGAKAIYFRGAAITAGVINAGDLASFLYDGTNYHLIAIDRWGIDLAALEGAITTSNLASNAQRIADALSDAVGVNVPLVIDGTGDDGDDVYMDGVLLNVIEAVSSAAKYTFAFMVPLVQDPTDLSDFQILAVASVGAVDWTNYTVEFTGIGGGKLYSVVLANVSGQMAMTGTLSVTELAVPSAQGVSF